MSTVWYWAVIEHHAGEYWATLPDLPGPNAVAASDKEALVLLAEFAADHVADLVARGAEVPAARSTDEIEHDPEVEVEEWGRALVPIDMPGKAVKVSLSMDEALLKRVDRTAEHVGETRSGFIAGAVVTRIRDTFPRELSKDDVARAIDGIDFSKVSLRDLLTEAFKK